MPLYIGDFHKQTSDFTLAEQGAYVRLLMQYWTHGPLPADPKELAHIAGMDHRQWRKSETRLLRQFEPRWHADVLLYHDDALDAKIRKRDEKSERGQSAAILRWRPRQ